MVKPEIDPWPLHFQPPKKKRLVIPAKNGLFETGPGTSDREVWHQVGTQGCPGGGAIFARSLEKGCILGEIFINRNVRMALKHEYSIIWLCIHACLLSLKQRLFGRGMFFSFIDSEKAQFATRLWWYTRPRWQKWATVWLVLDLRIPWPNKSWHFYVDMHLNIYVGAVFFPTHYPLHV